MKLSCAIVRDLLPLYEDDVCSDESRAAIDAHLRTCADCRGELDSLRGIAEQELRLPSPEETRAVARSFRKIRRRWATSLIAMLLVVPLLILSVDQARGAGLCFTNADEILAARQCVRALEAEDFEAMTGMMDFSDGYQSIQAALGVSEEDYMPTLIPVTVGGEEWLASKELFEAYSPEELEASDFWDRIIINELQFCCLIPRAAWDAAAAREPDAFRESDDTFYCTAGADRAYVPIETEWGSFLIVEGALTPDCRTAADLCQAADLIPAAVYEAGIDELERRAAENYRSIRDYYGEVADLAQEEYSALMRERHREQLEQCIAEGLSFRNTGYRGSSYTRQQDCWSVSYGLNVLYRGESYPITLSVSVKNGQVVKLTKSWSWDRFERDQLLDWALSMYYQPKSN